MRRRRCAVELVRTARLLTEERQGLADENGRLRRRLAGAAENVGTCLDDDLDLAASQPWGCLVRNRPGVEGAPRKPVRRSAGEGSRPWALFMARAVDPGARHWAAVAPPAGRSGGTAGPAIATLLNDLLCPGQSAGI